MTQSETVSAEYTRIPVGNYLVIGSGREWRVMERYGICRMLKKVFVTRAAAEKRAQAMNETDAHTV